jgi:hypothetical protein
MKIRTGYWCLTREWAILHEICPSRIEFSIKHYLSFIEGTQIFVSLNKTVFAVEFNWIKEVK